MEKKRPVLSISMLVSNNRRDTIEKCMESLVPLMEAVPSELIIVDTGCTDGSVDIARKYADKVVQFTWCKDFSAARNAGLKECTGEWFLYLDDDEWFEDVSELIDFFRGVEKDYCDALWYIQRNYDNFEGTVYTDAYVGRCVKLTPETEFRGKIHEWLYPLPNVLIRKNSYVHHYGYVFKTEEERQKHMMRNLTLLEAAIEENPKDTRMCCQLVQEYWVAKRHEDAVAFCRKALELTEEPGTDSYVQYLKYTIPRLYKDAGDAAKALEEFTRLEREDVLLHQTRLGIYYEKALLYNAQGDGVEARKWFAEYLREFYRTPGEGAPKEFAIMDFAQYQSEFFRLNAVYGGIRNMVRCNCFDEAELFFEEAEWTPDCKWVQDFIWGLLQCYMVTENKVLLIKYLPRILAVKELETNLSAALHMAYTEHPDKRIWLCEDLEVFGLRSGNFAYFHLLYTEQNGITTEQDIADYYEKSDRKYDAEVALLFLNKAKQRMELRSKYNKMGRIEASVKEYVRWARSYTEAVTEEGAWDRGELPQELPELWFARVMEFTFDVTDMTEYGGLIKEALSYCPVFLPVVKALLAEREMVTLAAQVKSAAQAQLAAGKPEEAQVMLAELATMVPWDEEATEMLRSLAADEGQQQTETDKKRKEVVFLPYKASMWDSLESVWKAAEADPECDAYVVPIPYYDKNPDGSFKQMHYEGDQYPAEVSVLWYEDYDFAARKPDVIFIHNPYDECNYVTSVEPAFYSKHLKQYTDKLVYIPYFVLGEIDPEDEEAVEKMSHFCTLPGVMNAHKVIVQSENMRQAYIKVLTDFAGTHTKKIWEEKILGTGSPKLDKVSNVTREDITVPEEWKPVLTKTDGSRKKVILYNTSITTLLNREERILAKMRDVFRVFQEVKDEVALLWRPHPLIQATIESMRPKLWEEYRALVEEYKAAGFGIYDDTADLNRAINLSDAYYGDASSLVRLCKACNIPVMIQNAEKTDSKGICLYAEDFVQVNNSLVFIAKNMNLICALDMGNKKIEIIGSLPEGTLLDKRLGAKIVYCENKLYFAPMRAKKIWIYNILSKEWKGIERKQLLGNELGEMFQAILYKNKIYFIGCFYAAIICMDIETENVEYFEMPYKELEGVKEKVADSYFRCDYVQKDNLIFMASCIGNYVLKFNLDTHEYEWLLVGNEGNFYSGITWDGNFFWLSPRRATNIVKWDGNDFVEEYSLPEEVTADKLSFLGVQFINSKIVMPALSDYNTIYISDLNDVLLEVVEERYGCYKKLSENSYICQNVEGKLEIRYDDNTVEVFDMVISYSDFCQYMLLNGCTSEIKTEETLLEHKALNLEMFIPLVCGMKKERIVMGDSCGEVVWKELQD